MFKRALLSIVILGMVSTPAMADLIGPLNPVTPANSLTRLHPNGEGGTVGVMTAGGGLYPNTAVTPVYSSPVVSSVVLTVQNSDILVVTFGIHWPYATAVQVTGMRHGLNWDTQEVTLLGAGPAGPFADNNIGGTPAAGAAAINGIVGATPNSSGIIGTQGVVGIQELLPVISTTAGGVVIRDKFIINGSDVIPFARFTFHVHNPKSGDPNPDIIMPEPGTTGAGAPTFGVGILFDFVIFTTSHLSFSTIVTNTVKTSTGFINFGSSRPSAGVQLHPEPASAALLGMGALALTGGFWRRRRRQA